MSAESDSQDSRRDILEHIAAEYYDLNGLHFDVLWKPPTALEFSRLVHVSRPVVIQGLDIPALNLWTNKYLIERMGDRPVSVAVTPNGRADAITMGQDDTLYFVEPLTEQMTMKELLDRLTSKNEDSPNEVYYLQSQNGNLYTSKYFNSTTEGSPSEFEPLRKDVPSEIPWCSEALDRPPDAVNLWVGDSRSVTSIHSDPYENIYTVVRGRKHFTLLPPAEGYLLEERTYPHATYTRPNPGSPLTLTPSDPSTPPVRWSSVTTPHLPGTLPDGTHPIDIVLDEGETLYLPPGWWHHVRQSSDSLRGSSRKPDDITIALNWWYDMEMSGSAWVWLGFLRGINSMAVVDEVDVEDLYGD